MMLSVSDDKVISPSMGRGKAGHMSSVSIQLRVFWVYKLVADSGDVVIQRQCFSVVDIHEPAISMPLSPF